MKSPCFLALESGDVVISTRPGEALGIRYDLGTVGLIRCDKTTDGDLHRHVQFTRSLVLDFSFFNAQNWEVLRHCAQCRSATILSQLKMCDVCWRQDYCPECLGNHDCHVPAIGVSREPRRGG
jgi:hypothetical protein